MKVPMPMETLHIHRLRLFSRILHWNDEFMIGAILQNHHLAQEASWLHGVFSALEWMREQLSDDEFISEVWGIHELHGWKSLQPKARIIKNLIKRAGRSHQLRIAAQCELQQADITQTDILKAMGWTLETPETQTDTESTSHFCPTCNAAFQSQAALATHQQRTHHDRMAVRQVVKDGCCRACRKQFHTRPRLIQHLQYGTTRCWIAHLRCLEPLPTDQVIALDSMDRERGRALHQHGLKQKEDDLACRSCTQQEFDAVQAVRHEWHGASLPDPSDEELKRWEQIGLLPPGEWGRDKTVRGTKTFGIPNVMEDTQSLERAMLNGVARWQPDYDWVPRPLANNQKYVLIFFARHRRSNDIADWVARESSLIPIPIDTAIHEQRGNIFNDELWWRLISARKVIAAHGAPPCESFSMARWLVIAERKFPRPLRNRQYPWGMKCRSLREIIQCLTGNSLFLRVYLLLLWVFANGGAISLEHPRGPSAHGEGWCIWFSAVIQRLLLHPETGICTFLQGPLGRPFAKPTSMLLGRLKELPTDIYSSYLPNWSPSVFLGGLDSSGKWKTTAAKEYPEKLCALLARSYIRFSQNALTEGTESDPE